MKAYPTWVREPILEMYRQGLNSYQIEALTGISKTAILKWCKHGGISRSKSESKKGKLNPNWKGNRRGYSAEHKRAVQDFPNPLGICQICLTTPATERARIDHTNFPYREEYVLPMCSSCNNRHNLYSNLTGQISDGFVILFQEVS